MKNIKRKGFTLVELLIVIVVIGILSAMMMMSSTEATTSAKASNIVSNLRNLKTAALAWYVDSLDAITAAPNITQPSNGQTKGGSMDHVIRYLGSTNQDIPDMADYALAQSTDKTWFITYNLATDRLTNAERERIKTKLVGRAKSVGLCNGDTPSVANYDGSQSKVALFIR